MSNDCAACGPSMVNVKACGRCYLTGYCSIQCQKLDRTKHKAACVPVQTQMDQWRAFHRLPFAGISHSILTKDMRLSHCALFQLKFQTSELVSTRFVIESVRTVAIDDLVDEDVRKSALEILAEVDNHVASGQACAENFTMAVLLCSDPALSKIIPMMQSEAEDKATVIADGGKALRENLIYSINNGIEFPC